MIYQQTPDFYNEYISHSAVWEGRSRYRNGEDELEHGWAKDAAAKAHKYIDRWRGKNGKWYYRYKSKAQELGARINRKRLGLKPDQIWNSKDPTYGDFDNPVRYDKGKANSRSGQTGSRLNSGISAGRKRAVKKGYKVKGYSGNLSSRGYSGSKRNGNLTSRGYSGSQGSGESKRQRNLGTRKVAGSNRIGTTISLHGPGSDGYHFTEPGWYWRQKSLEDKARRQDQNAVKTEVYTVINKKKYKKK